MKTVGNILFLTAVIAITFFLYIKPAYLGYVVSQAGNVTRVDARMEQHNYWQGLYGNLTSPQGANSVTLVGNTSNILRLNLNLLKCNNARIYATQTSSINWSNLAPAAGADIDTFLSVDASSPYSGTRVFSSDDMWNISGSMMSLKTMRMRPINGTFIVGAIKDGQNLVYVTSLVQAEGFIGRDTGYQMMLPVPKDQNITYKFFLDPEDLLFCNLSGRVTLVATLAEDNESVILRWPNLDADNYSIYMTDNLTSGFSLAVSGYHNTNWTDTFAGMFQQRYYNISASKAGLTYFATKAVGKFDIEIGRADGSPAQYELNQVSFPLIPSNDSLTSIARRAQIGDIILRFNTSDMGTQFVGWETALKQDSGWIRQFERMPYYEAFIFINVAHAYNMTLVGVVPTGYYSHNMVPVDGSPTGYEMLLLGWNSPYSNCVLDTALNTTSPPGAITWFDTTDAGGTYDGWQTFMLIDSGSGYSWFPTNGCMQPGKGYRFLSIGAPYVWNYQRSRP